MIKIASRQSMLAKYQAEMAKDMLSKKGFESEFIYLETSGDKKNHPLFAGKGIFIKELQERLLDNRADIAVHSLKDLPIIQTQPLALYGLLPRASKQDVLILSPKVLQETGLNLLSDDEKSNLSFHDLKSHLYKSKFFKEGPIGTSSLRRTLLIHQYLGQDLHCTKLRGNVNSRLARVQNNEYACIILAKAGLERLNLYTSQDMFDLDPKIFVPSAGQGIIAIEGCYPQLQPSQLIKICSEISSVQSCIEAGIERTVLYILGSDCYTPVGVYFDGTTIYVTTEVDSKFLSCSIKVLSHEPTDIKKLLNEHNNFYGPFFTALCKSEFAERIQKILKENKFI